MPHLNDLVLDAASPIAAIAAHLDALGTADCPLASLDLEWNGLLDRGARELGEALKTNDKLQRLRLGARSRCYATPQREPGHSGGARRRVPEPRYWPGQHARRWR